MRVLTIQLTLSIRALIESMKNTQKILASLLLSSLCLGASAANIIRTPAPITQSSEAPAPDDSAKNNTYWFTINKTTHPGGQQGCFNSSACTPLESSMNGEVVAYFTTGYGDSINFGMVNQRPYTQFKSMRIELINAAGSVYHVVTHDAPFSNQYGNYIGFHHDSELNTIATAATQFRVGFELF